MGNNRMESISEIKTDEKIISVKEQLLELGKIKSQYEENIKDYEQKASYYNDISLKIEEAEKELSRLKTVMVGYNKKESELLSLENKISESKNELSILIGDLASLNNKKDRLLLGISELSDSMAKSENEYKTSLKMSEDRLLFLSEELLSLDKNYNEKKSKYDDIVSKFDSELFDGNLSITNLKKEIASLYRDKELIIGELNSLSSKKISLINDIDSQSEELGNKKKEYIKEMAEYRNNVEKALIEREGIVSEREYWLSDKGKTLRETKVELEKFYERKINNSII